jgi:hypothetical protein
MIELIALPVGKPCDWCEEAFVDGDEGFGIPCIGEPSAFRFFHRACWLRQITGSLSHLRQECSCFVRFSTCTDPPYMTLREAAEAAAQFYATTRRA